MAYNKDEIFEQAKKAIIEHSLYFIEDVVAYVPCSRSTFYEFFPDKSDGLDTLKTLLDENNRKMKVQLRQKLSRGDKAAEILALYKLICTDEERKALQMVYTDNKHEVVEKVDLTKLSDDELRKLAEMQRKSGVS
jgi:hypothetical protein